MSPSPILSRPRNRPRAAEAVDPQSGRAPDPIAQGGRFRSPCVSFFSGRYLVVNESLATIFPVSHGLAEYLPVTLSPDDFPAWLTRHPACCRDFTFLPELASLELACHRLAAEPVDIPAAVREYTVNPSVRLLETNWTGLPEFLGDRSLTPQPGEAAGAPLPADSVGGGGLPHPERSRPARPENGRGADRQPGRGPRGRGHGRPHQRYPHRRRHPGAAAGAPFHPGAGSEFFSR